MAHSQRPPVFFTSPTWQMNGVNVFTENLALGLARRGYDSAVLLTDPHKHEPIPMKHHPDIEFIELETKPSDSMRTRWRVFRDFIERRRPCVYIPNYDWHFSCLSPCLSREIAIIGVVHSDDPRHYEHLDRLGDTWNAVIAVSRSIGRQIEMRWPQVAPRLQVIPIGVNVPDPSSRAFDDRSPLRVLYAGLLKQHQKRIFDVVDIVREVEERGTPVELTFAGGGADEENLRKICSDLVDRDRVRFTGILDRDRLAREFEDHDVFIMTSEFEGLPNALLEAMAHGLVPVVSAIDSGIPEVVRDGWNGLTAPVGDIAAFADLVTRLGNDRDLLKRMSARARRVIVAGPFNVDRMVGSYTEVIDRVTEEAVEESFPRPIGRIRPPEDLGPLWRHQIPDPIRMVWRTLKKVLR